MIVKADVWLHGDQAQLPMEQDVRTTYAKGQDVSRERGGPRGCWMSWTTWSFRANQTSTPQPGWEEAAAAALPAAAALAA